MHKEPETLGEILKTARMRADITMETLAERVDITERYLYRIENEGKKPSFDVLYKLIRELACNTSGFDFLSRKAVQRFRNRKSCPYALRL